MPGWWQAWPKVAACWSPAMPAIGIGAAEPLARCVRPLRPALATTSGSIACGMPNSVEQLLVPAQSVDIEQHRARRVARVGDVAAAQLEHQPAVDGAEGQLAALGARARARHVFEQPGQFGGREIGVEFEAGALAGCVRPCPASRRRSHSPAVRRSCQTMAWATGSPVARSHTHAWSRAGWRCRWRRPAHALTPLRAQHLARARRAGCSRYRGDRVRPSRAGENAGDIPAARCRGCWPSRSNRMARELVVPWSRARMY